MIVGIYTIIKGNYLFYVVILSIQGWISLLSKLLSDMIWIILQ